MKVRLMLLSIASVIGLSACGVGSEETMCTSEPESAWMDQEQFQQGLTTSGYNINEFKVTGGNCYEIYGTDMNGNKVEIYFNPVNGEIVKQETH
uniref:PepSY domain-containing protein n=1 Tax=Ningiella ruwaisensis TaxID=2364274 RepID=UPI00109F6429|nr:PepSY domain-containing protein [Ningiella ruwaisensis]